MNIKKIVITKGIYDNKELRLLVSFDAFGRPLDLINLDVSKVGTVCEATVEKVLNDINASILKLSTGDKGFIDNKKLKPDFFISRHSEKKLVCQEDRFWVEITQDKKGTKPYSCKFLPILLENKSFLDYYLSILNTSNVEIISDIPEYIHSYPFIIQYNDSTFSLWDLYSLTSVINKATSKIVHLKSGGNLIIETTEAMTVIDVNTAQNYGKTDAMKTNLEAIDELCHQIRLRSISGIIIVDLLKVSKDEEKNLISSMKNRNSDDYSSVTIHGFTRLGLLEITRNRTFATFSI